MERPVFILMGRGRPHLVMLLLFSLGVGLAYLLGLPQPRSVAENLGDPFQFMWSVGLVVSGLVGLSGAFWRGDIGTGLMLERAGMLIGAGSVFGYAWTVSQAGTSSSFAAGFCLAWGVANLVRAYGIGKDLRNLGRKKIKHASGRGERSGTGNRRPLRRRTNRDHSGHFPTAQQQSGQYGHPE